MNDPVKQQ